MASRHHHEISPFTTDELRQWRARLLEMRRGFLRDEAEVTADADLPEPRPRDAAEATPSTDLVIATRQQVHREVHLIDAALAKIASRDPVPFGICEETGMPIERDRLDLMPWTPVSSLGARLRESAVARDGNTP